MTDSFPPAIDIHVHTRTPGCRYDRKELETSIALARAAGIEHMVQLHNLVDIGDYDPSQDGVQRSNDLAMRIVEEHPDAYSGFCYLNPSHPPSFLREEIDRCVASGPLAGVKLWISVKASDRRLDPIMEEVARLRVPVLHHAWYKTTGLIFQESTPADIADLARRHPQATIIMAHLSGCGRQGVLDIKGCPNVVVDTSGGQPVAGLVEYAVEQLGASRVVYGSDWPIRNYATQVGRVLGAALSEEDRSKVLRENALRILGLRVPTA